MSDFTVDYNDTRFKDVETEKQNALTQNNNLYDGMISQSDSYYNAQIEESKKWAEQQQKLQQEQTDFTIQQIEQQKDQSKKDYEAEQSASFVDYKKQSNQFGVEAEQMASSGLANTGFSESSKVSMYNAYQNRVATARNSYNQIVMNYNNSIKEAQLQNSSVLAQIAHDAMKQQLELSLQGFQYKNSLLAEKEAQNQSINNTYYGRYQDVLSQINYENEMREQQRRYEEERAIDQQRYEEEMALEQQKLAMQQKQYEEEMTLKRQQLAYEKEQAAIKAAQEAANKKAQEEEMKKAQEEEVITNTAQSSGGKTMQGPKKMEIDGYGNLTKTNETYYINGEDVPIYATGDGTWWYWNEENGLWIRLAKNANKPAAVRRQEMLNTVMGGQTKTGTSSNSGTLPVNTSLLTGTGPNLFK